MSENLLIAIIGLIGAVLGGLIGAFGAMAAVEVKSKTGSTMVGGCGIVGLVASTAGAVGLVLGLLFAASIVQRLELTPSQPVTQPTPAESKPVAVVVTTTLPPRPVVQPPTPLPASPQIFSSEDRIPPSGVTTLAVRVNVGEVHAITSGPICVSEFGVCLPGGAYGQQRGSVVILLPRDKPYSLTGLVSQNNWHGSYYADIGYARSLAETLARELMVKSASNVNCDGGCNTVDILIVGAEKIEASYKVP